MRNYYTHYWTNKTWKNEAQLCKEDKRYCILDHSASNEFNKRGVSKGDHVYIVTNIDGEMYLGGRIEVDKLLNIKQAAIYLDMLEFELWGAKDHIVMPTNNAGLFTPENMIPRSTVKVLRFGNDLKPLVFRDGKLYQQALRGVRRLSPESAKLLDSFL